MNPASPALEALRARISERTGLDLSGRRVEALLAALERASAERGAPDPEALAQALVDGAAPLRPLLEELAVGETWFFREPAQWRFVEEVVVPEALARRRSSPVRFRGWSAACSTGEEPYSLAMLLDDLGLGDAVHLVATDLNETALERARRGQFSVWSLRGGADAHARRHLEARDGTYVLEPAIAARVRFSRLNLASAEYPSWSRGIADLDLVLCRNVLIYLDRTLVPGIARRLFAALAPGGWLLLGAADPPLRGLAPFTIRPGPFGLGYQRPVGGPAIALPPGHAERSRRTATAAATPGESGHPERSSAAPAAERSRRAATPTATATPGESGHPERSSAAPAAERSRRAATPTSTPPSTRAAAPDPRHVLRSARALLDAGRLAEALHVTEAALAREPLDASAWFEKAIALSELGRHDEAEEACGRALYLAPGEPFVHYFTALLRLRRADPSAAAQAFATAAALAARRPPAEPLALSHGLTAGEVRDAARAEAQRLAGAGSPPPAR